MKQHLGVQQCVRVMYSSAPKYFEVVLHSIMLNIYLVLFFFFKKNQNAPIPSEHPPVRRKNVKTFRWDQRLQIQNLFMAFKYLNGFPYGSNIGSTV